LLLFLAACSPSEKPVEVGPDKGTTPTDLTPTPDATASGPCPTLRRDATIPGIDETHRTAAYWVATLAQQVDLDQVLLSPEAIENNNRAVGTPSLAVPEADWSGKVRERLEFLAKQVDEKSVFDHEGGALDASDFAIPAPLPALRSEFHRAEATLQLRCGPRSEGFYQSDLDPELNRNHCSAAHPQELLEVVADWPNGMKLARTRYSFGWLDPNAALSPALTVKEVADAEASAPVLSFTRRNVLEAAFAHLGEPYGWGGDSGNRDCSRLLLDVFERFGLHLPRHSATQVTAGSFSVDVSTLESEKERLLLLDTALQRGIVLLHFPGHIMLYLGRDADGRPMALHSLAAYKAACSQPDPSNAAGESLVKVNQVIVSDLELGRGSTSRSYLERITHLTVIGNSPGTALQGIAQLRPAAPLEKPAACPSKTDGVALFVSPEVPYRGAPLRVIATQSTAFGSPELTLFDETGARLVPTTVRHLGGPPYAQVFEVAEAPEGEVTAVFGEGVSVLACERIVVEATARPRKGGYGAVWEPVREWGPDTENLYGAFVEALFDYSLEGDPTWGNLHTVLRDSSHNILYDHLSHNEEAALELQPDCADLPYTLRAYFAWKMGLPYGFRRCSRGSNTKSPTCGPALDALSGSSSDDPVRAFERFVNRILRNAVHSGSGRTDVDDEDTDYYPVPLTQETLRPGTLYADPYGHLLTVVRWEPQKITEYGVLVAADAQPDGTVGLKRFWRGTFLFSTATSGAGFKVFRPTLYDGKTQQAVGNDKLKEGSKFVPLSHQQYDGSVDDFYDTMDALINPRPLDPFAMQRWLLDAFEEAIQFRLLSVNNGEDYMSANSDIIPMPSGAAIFQTTGPWESFSTPSRDMRILIAIDTVVAFSGRARRNPSRFGIESDDLDATITALEEELWSEMAKRTFTYRQSDGTERVLSLKDVYERREGLEMAYNPNDCIEIRWGAPEGSDERAACKREAPSGQREKMAEYREWFAERRRP